MVLAAAGGLAAVQEPAQARNLILHLLACPVALLVAVREVRQVVVMEPEQGALSASSGPAVLGLSLQLERRMNNETIHTN